jgi:2'-hydroxyisoflavone reductase
MRSPSVTSRRAFLASTTAAGLAIGLAPLGAIASQRKAKPMRLLILGGTGFLGPHIVRTATDRGHEMTLFNRGKTNPHLFPNIEKLEGNRDPDKDAGLSALRGRDWDAVIDTSGYVPRIVDASASLLADHAGHYTFISSISVYDGFAKHGISEDDPVGTIEDETVEQVTGVTYGPLKALCEQAAEKAMPGRTISIRPGLIVGPGDPTDRFTYWPVRVSKGGEVLAPGTPGDPLQQIDARDLAAFVIHSIEQRTTGAYNAVCPADSNSMGKTLDACKAESGSHATFTWVPADFLEAQGVSAWGDLPNWSPTTGDLAGINQVDVERAIAKGLTIRPIAETIRDTLEWTREWDDERRNAFGNGRKPGLSPAREQAVLAAWKEHEGG